jgi:Uri superfamily endonuclease
MTTLPEAGGIYLLVIRCSPVGRPVSLRVRSGRIFKLAAGYYGYAGSARGGLAPRLARHLRTEKQRHWHVDYLLARASIDTIVCAVTAEKLECDFARRLAAGFSAVPGFGASDCGCPSHLFYAGDAASLIEASRAACLELGVTPVTFDYSGFNSRPILKAGPNSGPKP